MCENCGILNRMPFDNNDQSLKASDDVFLPTCTRPYAEEPTADAQTWFVPFSSFMGQGG